jgi:hypothetical protein
LPHEEFLIGARVVLRPLIGPLLPLRGALAPGSPYAFGPERAADEEPDETR